MGDLLWHYALSLSYPVKACTIQPAHTPHPYPGSFLPQLFLPGSPLIAQKILPGLLSNLPGIGNFAGDIDGPLFSTFDGHKYPG